MMKFNFAVIIQLIVIQSFCIAQNDAEKVVAKVGGKNITVEEFKERYQFSPQIDKSGKKNEEYLKSEFLYTIIAEKLWALEAEAMGYDTTDIMKMTFGSLKDMYMRDALYQNEIGSKINITPEDISEGIKRNKYVLQLKFIVADTQMEINKLYGLLNDGASFDSILTGRPEAKRQSMPLSINFGQIDKNIEDKLYALKINEITKPFNYLNEWYIFKLISKKENIITNSQLSSTENSDVEKIVEKVVTDSIYRKFYGKFFGNKKITTNGYLFWSFADKIIQSLSEKKIKENLPDSANINLDIDEYNKIEKKLGNDTLNMTFVKLDNDKITLKQFMRAFIFEGFYSNTTNADTVRAKLNSRVKRFIEHEMLAKEANKKGLQNMPETKLQIDIWRDYYLAKQMNNTFIDSSYISAGEVKNRYNEAEKYIIPEQVNIVEILSDSLDVISEVMKKLDEGIDIQELAGKYSKRKSTKDKNGESGYFPVTDYGEIGKIASTMEVGDTYGPLKVPEGYSIFKLIGKKKAEQVSLPPFNKVKDNLRKYMKSEKLRKLKIEKTVELANKYGITVDYKVLQSIKVKNLSMFVYKYFGFGGRNVALPIVPPFIDWVEPWQNSKKVLP